MFETGFTQRADEGAPGTGGARVRLGELLTRVRPSPLPGESSTPIEAGQGQEADGESEEPTSTAPAGRLVERWIPATVAGKASRLGTRRIGLLGVAVAVVVVLATGAFVLTDGSPAQRSASSPPLPVADLASSSVSSTSTSSAPETVVISVVGKVAEPGLVSVPSGARVADALDAAGGVQDPSDRRTVNLARHLEDGEQLYIGVPAPAGASRPGDAAAGPSGETKAKVDLNTAGADALEELPEVGEVTAKRIIEWRSEHGGFDSVRELRQVSGIGPKTFAELRDLVRTE